jgi:hypothetical protein
VPRPAIFRPAALGLLLATVIAVATACTAPEPEPSPTASAPVASPTETAPVAPALVPGGTATDNLPFFASVVQSVWNGGDRASGRAYIDALTAAGFDKARMEVTEDSSTVGNAAESLQFSVRWGDECLVGQVGPATGEPVAAVLPGLQSGTCLVGATRTIDW